MNDTFWGLLVLAIAILGAAAFVHHGLMKIGHGLDTRNAMLSLLGRQRGPRLQSLRDKP